MSSKTTLACAGALTILPHLAFAAGANAMLQNWGVQVTAVQGFGAGTLAGKLLGGDVQLPEIVRLVSQGHEVQAQHAAATIRLRHANVTHVLRLDGLYRDGAAAGRRSRPGRRAAGAEPHAAATHNRE